MRTVNRSIFAIALVLAVASALGQEPLVAEPYRDVRAGFELLLPPGYDFGPIGSSVHFAPPERIATLESSGYGTTVFGPFLRLQREFEDFRRCQAPTVTTHGDTQYVHDQVTVAGQPAYVCTVAPIDIMGDLMFEKRVRVRTPRGGAVELELTTCAHESCDGSRAWFEAMIASLRWLD